jgi:hyperosmotically inducible protein
MRFIRRTLLLAIVAAGGLAAYDYWSDHGWPSRPRAATLDAAGKLGDTMSESALTAKIKSKMALDDHVNARAINIDTAGAVVTLSGRVASKDERDRALRLARDTAGVTRVVDRLQVNER